MNNLKKYRELKGLTQAEVAVKAKMTVRQYQRYEAGTSEPTVSMAKKFAKILGTTLGKLFP